MNFPKNALKQQKKHGLAVCGSFWGEKQFLLIFVQFYCFEQKGLFTTNPNFPLDLFLFKLVVKKIFLRISELLFEIVIFWIKWEYFLEFSQKCFKTTEKDCFLYVAHFVEKNSFGLY